MFNDSRYVRLKAMEIGILDNNSYKSLQIAQATFVLTMRELARVDPVTVACLFRISKDEAKRLAETPSHMLQAALLSSPPILTIKGQDFMRGASPMTALLNSLSVDDLEAFQNTAAHINAFSGPVNNLSIESIETLEEKKVV